VAIWYILWPFVICYGHLVYFPVFACCTKKSGNPDTETSAFLGRHLKENNPSFRNVAGFDPATFQNWLMATPPTVVGLLTASFLQ
jgi:hypothetical protein